MLFVAIFAPPWPCPLPLFILFSRVVDKGDFYVAALATHMPEPERYIAEPPEDIFASERSID